MSLAIKHRAELVKMSGRGATLSILSKIDPSKTLTLRKRFVEDVNRRFKWLRRVIIEAVAVQDVLGLKKQGKSTAPSLPAFFPGIEMTVEEAVSRIKNMGYEFASDAQKVDGFMSWLNEMEEQSILEVTTRPGLPVGGQPWSNTYIQSAYQKGIARARQEMRNAGIDVPAFSTDPNEDVSIAFNQPYHAEKVAVLYTRTFRELKGVDDAMDQQLSRVLSESFAEGRGPMETANLLASRIDGIGLHRGRLIARTETIRAHHYANINEYEQASVEGVMVKTEWVTGTNPCPICESLSGKIFTIKEIRPLIPAHPNCVCVAVPVIGIPKPLPKAVTRIPTPLEKLQKKIQSTVLPRSLDDIKKKISSRALGGDVYSHKRTLLALSDEIDKAYANAELTKQEHKLLVNELKKQNRTFLQKLQKEGFWKKIDTPAHVQLFEKLGVKGLGEHQSLGNLAVKMDVFGEGRALSTLKMKYMRWMFEASDTKNLSARLKLINDAIDKASKYHVAFNKVSDQFIYAEEAKTLASLRKSRELYLDFRAKFKAKTYDFLNNPGDLFTTKVMEHVSGDLGLIEIRFNSLLHMYLFEEPKNIRALAVEIIPELADKKLVGFVDPLQFKSIIQSPVKLTLDEWMSKVANTDIQGFASDFVLVQDKVSSALADVKQAIDDIVKGAYVEGTGYKLEFVKELNNVLVEAIDSTNKLDSLLGFKKGLDKVAIKKFVEETKLLVQKDFDSLFHQIPNSTHNQILKLKGIDNPHFFTMDQKWKWWLGDADEKIYIEKQVHAKVLESKAKKKAKKKAAQAVESPKPLETVSMSSVDEEWDKIKTGFTGRLEAATNIGGMHRKYFTYHSDGSKWLFKPYRSDPFRAYADELAYKVGRLIDPDAIEVRVINMEGIPGSIQRWMSGVTDLGDDVLGYSSEVIEQLQREHVIDWLIGNHDAHGGQFIIKGKKIYGVDKGQAGKFLGREKLSVHFHPNSVYGAPEPVYNALYKAAARGDIKLDANVVLKTIKRVEEIPDDVFVEAIRPYCQARADALGEDVDDLIKQFLAKKSGLRVQFENFMTEVYGSQFKFVDAVLEVDVSISELKNARVVGIALKRDRDMIEDLNVLTWLEETKGGEELLKMRFKLTGPSTVSFENKLKSLIGGTDFSAPTTFHDPYYDKIEKALKTIFYHKEDLKFNFTTIEDALSLFDSLMASMASANAAEVEMATYYFKYLEKIEKLYSNVVIAKLTLPAKKIIQELKDLGVLTRAKIPATVPVSAPATSKLDYRVMKREAKLQQKKVEKGKAVYEGEVRHPYTTQEEYVIVFDDGTEIAFRGEDFPFAIKGEVEITTTNIEVEAALSKLERLGINAGKVTAEYEEKMYLYKHAYVYRLDEMSEEVKDAMALTDDAEAVRKLRKILSDYFRTDVTKLPGYNPKGSRSFFGTGWINWYRFDGFANQFLDKALYHDFAYGTDFSPEGLLNIFLNDGGRISARTERLRLGKVGESLRGASAVSDMNSGGASYFFTKFKPIDQVSSRPGLWLKRHVMDRLDANWYQYDAYGEVRSRDMLHGGPKRIKKSCITEVTLKHGIDLFSDVEYWVVGTESQKRAMIEIMRKHGYKVMPDGRSLDDFFRVEGEPGIESW